MHKRSILASAAFVAVLPSCQSALISAETPELTPAAQGRADNAEDWYFRAGAYAGYTEVDDSGSPTLEGGSGGGRGEIGTVLGAFELGGRFSLGLTNADVSDSMGAGSSVDLKSVDIYLEPVLRAYLGSASTRPYLEVFGGFAYAEIDVDTTVPPNLTVEGDQGLGYTYGAGVGVEFVVGNEISGPLTISVGAELRETRLDTDDFGGLDQQGVLGSILFGTRW